MSDVRPTYLVFLSSKCKVVPVLNATPRYEAVWGSGDITPRPRCFTAGTGLVGQKVCLDAEKTREIPIPVVQPSPIVTEISGHVTRFTHKVKWVRAFHLDNGSHTDRCVRWTDWRTFRVTSTLARIWTVICFLLLWLTKRTYLKLLLSGTFPGIYRKRCSIIDRYLQTYPDIFLKRHHYCASRSVAFVSLGPRKIIPSRFVGMQIRNRNLQWNVLNCSKTRSSDPGNKISDSISVIRGGYLQYHLSNMAGGSDPFLRSPYPFHSFVSFTWVLRRFLATTALLSRSLFLSYGWSNGEVSWLGLGPTHAVTKLISLSVLSYRYRFFLRHAVGGKRWHRRTLTIIRIYYIQPWTK